MISGFASTKIPPDGAIYIRCPDLAAILGTGAPAFKEGWVIIEADQPVDVDAVYTVGSKTGGLQSLHTERICGRRQELSKFQRIPLTTGLVAWQYTTMNSGNFPATVGFAANPSGIPTYPVPGSKWITGDVWQVECPPSHFEFQYCFELCEGAVVDALTVQAAGTSSFVIQMNGQVGVNQWYSTSNPWHTPPTTSPFSYLGPVNVTFPASFFHSGVNCITVSCNDFDEESLQEFYFGLKGEIVAKCGCG